LRPFRSSEVGNKEAAMLVLTRRIGESIRIGDDIVVTLVQIGPGKVRLGIEAAPDVVILREELLDPKAAKPFPAAIAVDSAADGATFRMPHAK
jgi:carbon storage regulator